MDLTQILLAVIGALWFITVGLVSLVWHNLECKMTEIKKEVETKVDKDVYEVGQLSLVEDMRDLKKSIKLMYEAIQEIKLSLAAQEGARIERQKIWKEGE